MKTPNRFRSPLRLPMLLLVLIVLQALPGSSSNPARGATASYSLNVLLVTPAAGLVRRGMADHFRQTLVPNVRVDITALPDVVASGTGGYDLVSLDTGLASEAGFDGLRHGLEAFVASGGVLFLSSEYADQFPQEFLGISKVQAVPPRNPDLDFPSVGQDLSGVQGVWKALVTDMRRCRVPATGFRRGVMATTAKTVAGRGGLAFLTATFHGKGVVIWADGFLPYEGAITNLDFVNEGGQSPFSFLRATANLLFRTELLGFVSRRKYGFAIRKILGPWGRPGLAWQNHFEAMSGIRHRAMIVWIDELKRYGQIPSFSLIRGSYDFGCWFPTIRWTRNVASGPVPIFDGLAFESFFSSGDRLRTEDGYSIFSAYPKSVNFYGKIDQIHTVHIDLADLDVDGKPEIVLGTPEGKLFIQRRAEGATTPDRYTRPQDITDWFDQPVTERDPAPCVVDLDGDGKPDLLIGTRSGAVTAFRNHGNGPGKRFRKVGNWSLAVIGAAVPRVADWDGDGVPDLLCGQSDGRIAFFRGLVGSGIRRFTPAGFLRTAKGWASVGACSAPWITDWNGDGKMDLVVGSMEGTLNLFLGNGSDLVSAQGMIPSIHRSFDGGHSLLFGHQVSPVMADLDGDGHLDFLTGQLDYGIPLSIDDPTFPGRDGLVESIRYARSQGVPVMPHLFLHPFLPPEAQREEIARHRLAFERVGIDWRECTGSNQHTWGISEKDPRGTFEELQNNGIWWNSGFCPPGIDATPPDGLDFMWVFPFRLNLRREAPFLIFQAAPRSSRFPGVWDTLAGYDVPLDWYEHVEMKPRLGSKAYQPLLRQVEFMNQHRNKHEYNFMTEEQMARSMLNAFETRLEIRIDGEGLTVVPDVSQVPSQAGEYVGCLGVRVERGERYSDRLIETESPFLHSTGEASYIGIPGPTTISFHQGSPAPERFRIVRANGPLEWNIDGDSVFFRFRHRGLQQVKFRSPVPLRVLNKDVTVERTAGAVIVTRFGGAM